MLAERLKPFIERAPPLAQALRAARELWRYSRARPVTTPDGFVFAGDARMQRGEFEPHELALVRDELRSAELFIDAGANTGLYSCLARSRGARVIAVEPLPANLRWLLRNLAANGYRDVQVLPLALGERPGVLQLYGASTGASLVRGWAGASPLFERSVPVSTLDLLITPQCRGKRTLVKLDIEGGELPALRGAEGLLSSSPAPVWLVEVNLTEHHPDGLNPTFAEVFELFWRHGYAARTVEAEPREVLPADVARWVRARARDFGSHDYLFRKPS